MILDTTAIIDILNGDVKISAKIKELLKMNTPIFLTSISVFEIWQGTSDIKDNKKLEKICNLLDSLGIFLFDIPSAKEAGSIHASLRENGIMIDPEDSMIAGIAKNNKEAILTRNVKHFQRINGLEIEPY